MADMDQYAQYFVSGMKVGVGIPTVHNAEIFRDWAMIHMVDEDLLVLQLSRDQLPLDVQLHVGLIIEVRGGREGAGYGCHAIIVSEGDYREVLLRLIGDIVTDELREFYRIDAFLPIKFYVSQEQRSEELEKQWSVRREMRIADELMRKQEPWHGPLSDLKKHHRHSKERPAPSLVPEEFDTSWDTIIPLAANISGGGVRILAHTVFTEGEYVPLEIMVPSPRRIVETVARVVFTSRNYAVGGERECYNVSMKFVFIDERDRDAIVNYIANVQLKRIRKLREQYSLRDAEMEEGPGTPFFGQTFFQKTMIVVLVVSVMLALGFYFWRYAQYHPKGEIQETFEQGIRNYLQKLGK